MNIGVLSPSTKFLIINILLPLYAFILNPNEHLFQAMSHFATASHEKERLQYFASPEGRDDLYQYNQKERRTVLEVMSNKLLHFPVLSLSTLFGNYLSLQIVLNGFFSSSLKLTQLFMNC